MVVGVVSSSVLVVWVLLVNGVDVVRNWCVGVVSSYSSYPCTF